MSRSFIPLVLSRPSRQSNFRQEWSLTAYSRTFDYFTCYYIDERFSFTSQAEEKREQAVYCSVKRVLIRLHFQTLSQRYLLVFWYSWCKMRDIRDIFCRETHHAGFFAPIPLCGEKRQADYRLSTLFTPFLGLIPALMLFGAMGMLSFFVSHYLNRLAASWVHATVLSFKGLAYNLSYGFIGVLYAILVSSSRGSVLSKTPFWVMDLRTIFSWPPSAPFPSPSWFSWGFFCFTLGKWKRSPLENQKLEEDLLFLVC